MRMHSISEPSLLKKVEGGSKPDFVVGNHSSTRGISTAVERSILKGTAEEAYMSL